MSSQDDLPKDKNRPFIINGIRFANRQEHNERVKDDAQKLAEFLFDIYTNKKRKDNVAQSMLDDVVQRG